MADTPHLFREVFIVRFWREQPSPAPWRGQVQHVRSGETAFFRDLQELLDHLERRLGDGADHSNSQSRGLR
ncbi:MAG: hypothetical protein ACE5F6_01905 [Anaerolineae bacterium]